MYDFSFYQACIGQTQLVSHDSHASNIRKVVGDIASYHKRD
jgi:hypothetical protein